MKDLLFRIRVAFWLLLGAFISLYSQAVAERLVIGYGLALKKESDEKLDELLKRNKND